MKIKLLDYQIHSIKTAIQYSYEQIEDAILKKYKAWRIEDLNACDYEAITEDIQDWHWELNQKYK